MSEPVLIRVERADGSVEELVATAHRVEGGLAATYEPPIELGPGESITWTLSFTDRPA